MSPCSPSSPTELVTWCPVITLRFPFGFCFYFLASFFIPFVSIFSFLLSVFHASFPFISARSTLFHFTSSVRRSFTLHCRISQRRSRGHFVLKLGSLDASTLNLRHLTVIEVLLLIGLAKSQGSSPLINGSSAASFQKCSSSTTEDVGVRPRPIRLFARSGASGPRAASFDPFVN